jgi:hypothetical protein
MSGYARVRCGDLAGPCTGRPWARLGRPVRTVDYPDNILVFAVENMQLVYGT